MIFFFENLSEEFHNNQLINFINVYFEQIKVMYIRKVMLGENEVSFFTNFFD